MKNYIKRVVLIFLMVTSLSCDKDILTENPKSFLTAESFPKSEKDAIAATNAAYSRLYINPRELYYGFVGTDEAFQGFHNKRPITWFINLNSFNEDASSFWVNDYEGVARANAVIDLVPSVEMNEDLKERLVAEAKFLRAFYYFMLVRKYGGVPIIDHVLVSPDELIGVERNTKEEVYSLIKQDLNDAIAVLPNSYSANDLGRATKWAAVGILAKVHMTLQEWQKADELLDMIINSGDFGLYADYNKNFRDINENQLFPDKNGSLVNELIWGVQFAKDERGHTVTQQTGSRDLEVGGNSSLWGGFENMLPTPEFRAMFDEGDLRLPISYVEAVPTEDGGMNVLESPRTPGAGPISGKYHNPESAEAPEPNNSGTNIIVLRYADILLLKAETQNELGNVDQAENYINMVRDRAGVPLLDGLSQQEMTLAMRNERSLELSFEGHRRYDLIRWGIYVETMRNTTSAFLQSPRENIEEYMTLLPIPQNELAVSNGSIKQNPGY